MKRAILVQGMTWGDESKGATVDFLSRELGANLVVRFNGGPQAAHNVVANGQHHTFAQFGSNAFIPKSRTHLSQYMLVNPLSQMNEAEHLIALGINDIWERTTVHKDCTIITPFHRELNCHDEVMRGTERHGTCGVGLGAARQMELELPDITLRAGDLSDKVLAKFILEKQLRHFVMKTNMNPKFKRTLPMDMSVQYLLARYAAWPAIIVPELDTEDVMIFEGAQGVLLDETLGVTPPHVTWTDCTFNNAFKILKETQFDGEVTKIGCFRTYFTRHGVGPFPTEMNPSSEERIALVEAEKHNVFNRWQKSFRVGEFYVPLAKYAIDAVGGLDGIALSHNDVRSISTKQLAEDLQTPIAIMSYGPSAEDRKVKDEAASLRTRTVC